jgi:hypothetical protein
MPMDFELTISGLCVIILDSQEEKPEHPAGVEVLCVGACAHQPRLSYLPSEVSPAEKLEEELKPALMVDPMGVRSASLDISEKALMLEFKNQNPEDGFFLKWGQQGSNAPLDESLMDWVPTSEDLGFEKLNVGTTGMIPGGARARLSLPPGKLMSRNVVRNPVSNSYFVWKFPQGKVGDHALANEVVYRAEGVEDLRITQSDGQVLLEANKSKGTLYMSISNDLSVVPPDYNDGSEALDHLSHLQGLASSSKVFVAPTVVSPQRTGHPICNQVLYLNGVSGS